MCKHDMTELFKISSMVCDELRDVGMSAIILQRLDYLITIDNLQFQCVIRQTVDLLITLVPSQSKRNIIKVETNPLQRYQIQILMYYLVIEMLLQK